MHSPPRSAVTRLVILLSIVFAVMPAIQVQIAQAVGTISGTAFRDFNEDGLQQLTPSPGSIVIDRGIGGITVKAYDPSGTESGSAVTCNGTNWANGAVVSSCTPAQLGAYQLTASGTGPYRIEFTWNNSSRFVDVAGKQQVNPLFGLQPGPRNVDSVGGSGAGNSSSTVQFVQDGTTSQVNLAVNFPTDYCQSNPKLVSNRVIIADPLAVPSQVANEDVLLTFPYSATGAATNGGTPYTSCASYAQIGSTWGLSYQRTSGRVFTSAVLKRHSGLGPLGVSGIYVADPNVAGSGTGWYNGINAGSIPSNSARGLTGTGSNITSDVAAFGLIGKVGFGDIDTSEDDTTLYVTNLADRKLYAIDIAAVDAQVAGYVPTSYSIPDPACTNGIARPWAVNVYRGFVYVGVVCTGELPGSTAADLTAHVYALDPSTSIWSASLIDLPLNYSKGCTFFVSACNWQTWTDSWLNAGGQPNFNTPGGDWFFQAYRPMPILSDIEFDEEGYMILGFLDRAGHMLGHRNGIPVANSILQMTGMAGGDLLIAAPPAIPGDKYIPEADGRAGNRTSSGTGLSTTGEGGPLSGQGPHNPANGAGAGGEFFWDEHIMLNHSETSSGGLAYLPGSQEVTVSVMDPIQTDSGGVSWFNSVTGGPGRDYEIYFDNGVDAITAGKGNGIGDMELLCNAAPIEIGNRVWFDPDKNGIQDAAETPIAGVTVNLYNGNNVLIDTAVTNANGEWYFSSSVGVSSSHARYNVNLKPNQNYFIRLDNTQNYALQGPLEKYDLTLPNVGSSPNRITNNRNSKATLAEAAQPIGPGNYPTITYTTGGPGSNDHTLDIGFSLRPTAISLTSFTASPTAGGVLVSWVTAAELNTYGFRLVRSANGQRVDAVEVTSAIIPGRGRGQGATYAWVDTSAEPGIAYTYWLIEVEVTGTITEYGPTRVSLQAAPYYMLLPSILK